MSFVKEVSTRGRNRLTEEEKKKSSALIEKHKKEDARIVKGIFKNLECPGGDVEFAYHKYPGEPTRVYRLVDGHEYDLPFGVAKHINQQCKYKKSKHLVDTEGNMMVTADKPIERYQFVSTDFM
jgi:hypothetical protein